MIIELLEEKLNEIIKPFYDTNIKVIKSNRPELSDYQYDGLFKLANMYKKNVIELGTEIEQIINNCSDFSDYFSKVEFMKPGFINLTLSNKLINDAIVKMSTTEKFCIKPKTEIQTYFLDYGGPNIAKPLHVGHMRSAIVGESVKRIINYIGHKTIADVHFGDFGLQIGQVIYGLMKLGIEIEDIKISDLEELYPKISRQCKEDEDLKQECAQITKDLQDGNEEYYKYYKKMYEVSSNDIKKIYKYLDVDFDLWLGEMDAKNFMEPVENILNEKKLLVQSEGAKVINICETSDSKELPPLIFQKQNGAYLYGSTDMATIYQRETEYNPDYILYFTDLRQNLHFKQVFRASYLAGITDATLEHLGFGTVNGLDGKPFKTRSGATPKLEDLFEEVKEIFISKKDTNKEMSNEDVDKIVNSIIKFADLQNNREKDYIFDILKFSDIIGKTGPYILYTYLRINKLIDKKNIDKLTSNIYNEYDRNLRKKLIELDTYVNRAFEERMPSHIAEYIYDLAVLVNSFYQNNHINSLEDQIKSNDWLYILNLSQNVLKQMLDLLIIDIPSIM